jgi:hypothetical protein
MPNSQSRHSERADPSGLRLTPSANAVSSAEASVSPPLVTQCVSSAPHSFLRTASPKQSVRLMLLPVAWSSLWGRSQAVRLCDIY